MCEPATIAMGAMAVAGALSAYGQAQQGKASAQVGRNNQIMAEYAAQDAIKRGEEDAIKVRQRGDQIKGAQRAKMAASGIDLGVGTAAELQSQTDFFGLQDVATTRNNAAREAWSDRVQGANFRAQGDFARQQGNLGAFSTALGTAGQVAGKWMQYSGKGG